jgi:hypothetical protein
VGDLAEAARGAGRLPEVRTLIEKLLQDMSGSTPGLSIAPPHARLMLAPDGRAEAELTDALAADLPRWPLARARLLLAHGSGRGEVAEAQIARGLLCLRGRRLRGRRRESDQLGEKPIGLLGEGRPGQVRLIDPQ